MFCRNSFGYARLFINCLLITALAVSPEVSYAQSAFMSTLPAPGTMVASSNAFTPVLMKGMTIDPANPMRLDFLVNSGDTGLPPAQVRQESARLVKYFLAAMTVPQNDLWVNLSPYEAARIIPDALGKTDLGRDMLAQDYILKQLSASLMDPEKDLGRDFWTRVHDQARAKFGMTEIPVDVFNKVWIMPDQAVIYEKGNTVYIVKSRLKVMLDRDYHAMKENSVPADDATGLSAQVIREVLLPEIAREVNEGRNFAAIRQVYQALILAQWYKETVKNSLITKVYVDQNKIRGVDLTDPTLKDKIYAQYVEAFKKGVVNIIKEENDPVTQTALPRKYFSGGEILGNIPLTRTDNPAQIAPLTSGEDYKLALRLDPQQRAKATVGADQLSEAEARVAMLTDDKNAAMLSPEQADEQNVKLLADHFANDPKKFETAIVEYQAAYRKLGKEVSREVILRDEFLLVADPDGEYTKSPWGQIEVRPRELVHLDGTWHRTAGVFVVDTQGRIYLQQRAFTKKTKPGAWDVSAGGHLGLDADPKVGVARELEEEFFNSRLKIDPDRLKLLTAKGQLVSNTNFEPGINEQAVFYVYEMNDAEQDKISLQEPEVNIPKKGPSIEPTQTIMDWLARRDEVPADIDLVWLFGTKNTRQAYDTAAFLKKNNFPVLITGGIGKGGNAVTLADAKEFNGLKDEAAVLLNSFLDGTSREALIKKFNIDPANPKVDLANLDRLLNRDTRDSAFIPEGLLYWAVLRSMGIADERILVDAQSTSTGENVTFGTAVLAGQGITARKVIAVQESAMERRAAASLQKGLGPDVKVYARAPFLFVEADKIGNSKESVIQARAERAIKEIDKIQSEFSGTIAIPLSVLSAYNVLGPLVAAGPLKIEVDLDSLAFDRNRLSGFASKLLTAWGDVADPAKLPNGYSIGMLFFRNHEQPVPAHVQKLDKIMKAREAVSAEAHANAAMAAEKVQLASYQQLMADQKALREFSGDPVAFQELQDRIQLNQRELNVLEFNLKTVLAETFTADVRQRIINFKRSGMDEASATKVANALMDGNSTLARALAIEIERRLVSRDGLILYMRPVADPVAKEKFKDNIDRYNRIVEGVAQLLTSGDYGSESIFVNSWTFSPEEFKAVQQKGKHQFTQLFFGQFLMQAQARLQAMDLATVEDSGLRAILESIRNIPDITGLSDEILIRDYITPLLDHHGLNILGDLQEKFFLYSAPPGAGKGTIMKVTFQGETNKAGEYVAAPYESIVKKYVLIHSRKARVHEQEVNGVSYHFWSKEKIAALEKETPSKIAVVLVNGSPQAIALRTFEERLEIDLNDPTEQVLPEIDRDVVYSPDRTKATVTRSYKGILDVFEEDSLYFVEGGYAWFQFLKEKYPAISLGFISPFSDKEMKNRSAMESWLEETYGQDKPGMLRKAYEVVNRMVQDNKGEVSLTDAFKAGIKSRVADMAQSADGNAESVQLNRQAMTYIQDQQYDKAEELLLKALAMAPKVAVLWANLGGLQALKGDKDKALDALLKAVRFDPDNGVAWNTMADILSENGQFYPAREAYLNAIRCGFITSRTYFNLAEQYRLDRNDAEAEKYLHMALQQDPVDIESIVLLKRCLLNQGKEREALQALLKIALLAPQTMQFNDHANLATLLIKFAAAGETRPFLIAVQALLQAIQLQPEDAVSWQYLGYSYHRLGQLGNARKAYERSIQLGGSDPEIERHHAQVIRDINSNNAMLSIRPEEQADITDFDLQVDRLVQDKPYFGRGVIAPQLKQTYQKASAENRTGLRKMLEPGGILDHFVGRYNFTSMTSDPDDNDYDVASEVAVFLTWDYIPFSELNTFLQDFRSRFDIASAPDHGKFNNDRFGRRKADRKAWSTAQAFCAFYKSYWVKASETGISFQAARDLFASFWKDGRLTSTYDEALGKLPVSTGSAAMTTGPSGKTDVGGINFNLIGLERQGEILNTTFDPAAMRDILNDGIDGFTPVIIDLTPIKNMFPATAGAAA